MNSSFVIRHSSLPFGDPPRKAGFTLIEILIVVGIMAILGTITLGTSRLLIQTSRERRAKVTRDALNVALHRYRTEYQQWPVSKSDVGSKKGDYREGTTAYNGCYWYEWKDNNDEIFDALRAGGNSEGIRFLDETTVYTKTGSGKTAKVVPLSETGANSKGNTLCYAMKRDNKPAPFIVWICFDTDEAEVGPRDDYFMRDYNELNGITDDSDDAKYGD